MPYVVCFCVVFAAKMIAYVSDNLVGAICCRIETTESKEEGGAAINKLYIMTLGVLAPYRQLGIGKQLVSKVLDYVEKTPELNLSEVYLHVQTSNDTAQTFYGKFGFSVTGTIENYYKVYIYIYDHLVCVIRATFSKSLFTIISHLLHHHTYRY